MTISFEATSDLLKSNGIGWPVMVLDLDAIDHNIDAISATLGERFRVVTKSLPSIELLKHVMERANTNRLMAFHLPYLPIYQARFPNADILMGKPFLARSIKTILPEINTNTVQWLVDTPVRLEEHLALAKAAGRILTVNIEIDIGLHRGGVSNLAELMPLLDTIAANPDLLHCGGLMGYEAHVPHYPDPDTAFEKAMNRYAEMARATTDRFGSELTLNSGGSTTFSRFANDETVNDVATGSAVVYPATFDLPGHQPAQFIAAPVLRRFPKVSRQPVPAEQALSIYLYGGGWAADVAWPKNFTISPHADPANQNLLPNQCLFETGTDSVLNEGDFAFFRPQQGDALFQFEETLVIRGDEIVDRWRPVPRRY